MIDSERRQKFSGFYTELRCAYCHEAADFTRIKNSDPIAVICNVCGLHRVYPRISLAGQLEMIARKERYGPDDVLDTAQSRRSTPEKASYYLPALTTISKHLPSVFLGGKVLDVGTWDGGFVGILNNLGAKAIGLEQVSELAEFGQKAGLDIRVGRFDENTMSNNFGRNSFDLICFFESIEYMQDWQEVFLVVRNYLVPGGGLYIKSHSAKSSLYMWEKDYESRKSFHGGVPTRRSYLYMMEREGFDVCESGFWPERFFLAGMVQKHIGTFIARVVSRVLSPMISILVNLFDRGDRVFVCAKLKLQTVSDL